MYKLNVMLLLLVDFVFNQLQTLRCTLQFNMMERVVMMKRSSRRRRFNFLNFILNHKSVLFLKYPRRFSGGFVKIRKL